MLYSANVKNVLIGRLEHGSDLLDELQKICIEQKIMLGRIQGIGAVQRARLAWYDQEKKIYHYTDLEKHLEIVSLSGNISLKEGKPFVHAHIVLSDGNFQSFGGHLAQGTLVFACEITIDVLQDALLERALDNTTQLYLWKSNDIAKIVVSQ